MLARLLLQRRICAIDMSCAARVSMFYLTLSCWEPTLGINTLEQGRMSRKRRDSDDQRGFAVDPAPFQCSTVVLDGRIEYSTASAAAIHVSSFSLPNQRAETSASGVQ